eukprot:4960837-Amphidinium_carterae.1
MTHHPCPAVSCSHPRILGTYIQECFSPRRQMWSVAPSSYTYGQHRLPSSLRYISRSEADFNVGPLGLSSVSLCH